MGEGLESVPHAQRHERVSSFAQREAAFLDRIETMKKEGPSIATLVQRFENEYDALLEDGEGEAAYEALFGRFSAFLEKREAALNMVEVVEGDSEHSAEAKAFEQAVIDSFRQPDLFEGNGGTAEVYQVRGHPQVCVKYITNQKNYNEGNHMRVEFDFLQKTTGMSTESVYVPKPYFLRIHAREGHSYGMERIDGKSLSQIMERPHEWPDLVRVARALDRGMAYKHIEEFLRIMHERGITHNDLFARNIMLDTSGRLAVIDFGKAVELNVGEGEVKHDMNAKSDRAVALAELKRFFKAIDKVKL